MSAPVIAFIIESLGAGEIVALLVLAMVVVGPERLPETARRLGTVIAKARRAVADMTRDVSDVMEDPAMAPLRELGEFAVRPKQKLAELVRAAELDLELADQRADRGTKPVSPSGPVDLTAGTDAGDSSPPSDSSSAESPIVESPIVESRAAESPLELGPTRTADGDG